MMMMMIFDGWWSPSVMDPCSPPCLRQSASSCPVKAQNLTWSHQKVPPSHKTNSFAPFYIDAAATGHFPSQCESSAKPNITRNTEIARNVWLSIYAFWIHTFICSTVCYKIIPFYVSNVVKGIDIRVGAKVTLVHQIRIKSSQFEACIVQPTKEQEGKEEEKSGAGSNDPPPEQNTLTKWWPKHSIEKPKKLAASKITAGSYDLQDESIYSTIWPDLSYLRLPGMDSRVSLIITIISCALCRQAFSQGDKH